MLMMTVTGYWQSGIPPYQMPKRLDSKLGFGTYSHYLEMNGPDPSLTRLMMMPLVLAKSGWVKSQIAPLD